ncbi:MAG: hypothetical protein ACFFCG_03680 [Promethearchaeota archaeon]
MMIFLLFSYSFISISIRYLFLLEIRIAAIIGIIICAISVIGHFVVPAVYLIHYYFEGRDQLIVISMVLMFLMFLLNLLLLFFNFQTNPEEEAIVKRKIIEYGKKIARLKIKDISEKSNIDSTTVFRTLKEMIKNQEIYAAYFKSSKTVAFNQIANIENLDSLMKLYEDWEHQKIKKV